MAKSPRTPQRLICKFVSIFLSFLFVFPSLSFPNPPQTSAPAISISEKWGVIDEVIPGTNGKTVVYIQDAHDSLDAQENIARIILDFVNRGEVQTVFEEGYEGPVPSDEYFGFIQDPETRRKVSFLFMNNLRIGGAEYAHINRRKFLKSGKKDFKLIGADSVDLLIQNVHWYRQTAKRSANARDLQLLLKEMERLANLYFPKELKEWIKLKKRLEENQIGLLDYLKRLPIPEETVFPHLGLLLSHARDEKTLQKQRNINSKALFSELDDFENKYATGLLKTEKEKKIYTYYKSLLLFNAVSGLRITPAEYGSISDSISTIDTRQLADFLTQNSQKPIVLSNQWQDNLRSAMRFYSLTEARDEAMAKKLEIFLNNPEEKTAILVYGGFHKNRIKEILQEMGVSIAVVSPKIHHIDEKRQAYYQKLMSAGNQPFAFVSSPGKATRYPPIYVYGLIDGPNRQKKNIYRGALRFVPSLLPRASELRSASTPAALDGSSSLGRLFHELQNGFKGNLEKTFGEFSEAEKSEFLLRIFQSEVYPALNDTHKSALLNLAISHEDKWTEKQLDDFEDLLVLNLNKPKNKLHKNTIEEILRTYSAHYLEAIARVPDETLVIIQAGGLGTRLNVSGQAWQDKNTLKMGGVSQLQRQLNMLAALGYKNVVVIHNSRNADAVRGDIRGYPAWFNVQAAEQNGGWMQTFTAGVQQAKARGFKKVQMINGESLVDLEYLAQMRFNGRERTFGFHPYEGRGMHQVEIQNRRLEGFGISSAKKADNALLTFTAPTDELLERIDKGKSLEDYMAEFYDSPQTGAFRLPSRQRRGLKTAAGVPDLNTPEDLEQAKNYHDHNREILGPFPYEQMVHPQRMARALLIGAGLFYGPQDIEPDELHDANNRGTVWFTRDRKYVIKAFVGINDSRYETGRFTDDRYQAEKRFLQSKIPSVATADLIASNDTVKVLVMNHLVGRAPAHNLADMITKLPKKDSKGKEEIISWMDQWMLALSHLQKAEDQPAWNAPYDLENDLGHTEEQVRDLRGLDHDMESWTEGLDLFREYYARHPSPEVPAQGDYAPLNFIVSAGREFLIDGEFSGKTPREKDLATAIVRMHQMNMRTGYVGPNPHLENNFESIITSLLESYERHTGYTVNRAVLYFYIAQDFMQRAFDQIHFKNDDLSPRQYLELSYRYLYWMRQAIRGDEESRRPLGIIARDVFGEGVAAKTIIDDLRNGKISNALLYYHTSPHPNYILDLFFRLTADRESVVRKNAFVVLGRLGWDLAGPVDLARDYRYLAYHALNPPDLRPDKSRPASLGNVDTALRLFRFAQKLHAPGGPSSYPPYEEKMKEIINQLRIIQSWLDNGIEKKERKPGKRILVVGGSGFLGRRVLEALLKTQGKDAVLVIADQNRFSRQGGSKALHEAFDQGRIIFEPVDMRDPFAVEEVFDRYGGFEQAINLAAMKSPAWSQHHPAGAIAANVMTSLYYVSAQYGTRLVQISTAELYPDKDDGSSLTEEDRADPTRSPYSASKYLMEVIPALMNIPAVSFRMTTLYGPGEREAVVSGMIYQLLSSQETLTYYGNVVVDFLRVDEAAALIAQTAGNANINGVYNLSTGTGIPLYEAAQVIREELEQVTHQPIRPERLGTRPGGPLKFRVLDNNKLRKELGSAPKAGFREGIRQVIREQVEFYGNQPLSKFENLTGNSWNDYKVGELLSDEPGRFYILENPYAAEIYVTSGPAFLGNRRLVHKGRVKTLQNLGYWPENNLTVWAEKTTAELPGLITLSKLDNTTLRVKDERWIYLGDTQLFFHRHIPSTDGYWIHSETKQRLMNEEMSFLLVTGQLEAQTIGTPLLSDAHGETSEQLPAEGRDLQILEINTRHYFKEKGYASFDDLTTAELQKIKAGGVNTVWFLGIWEESDYSRMHNERTESPELQGKVASAFAIPDHTVNPKLGGEEKWLALQKRAEAVGLKVGVDFIPNHAASDSPLLEQHPDWFIRPKTLPAEGAARYFYFPRTFSSGDTVWFTHARPDAAAPWKDTAQLDILKPEVWSFLKSRLLKIAFLTGGGLARTDALTQLFPEEYRAAFYPELSQGEFNSKLRAAAFQAFGKYPERTGNPFEILLDEVRNEYPGFLTLGEAYRKQEGYWQQVGFDLTYAKYVYDWLVNATDGGFANFKDYVLRRGPHAGISPEYYYRSLYLLEDHDTHIRILEALRKRLGKPAVDEEVIARSKLLLTAISTIPGAPLIYEGQSEGEIASIATANLFPRDPAKAAVGGSLPGFYHENLSKTNHPVFRRGNLPSEIPVKNGAGSVFAFVRTYKDSAGIVVLNYSAQPAQVTLDLSAHGLGEITLELPAWGTSVEIKQMSELRLDTSAEEAEAINALDLLEEMKTPVTVYMDYQNFVRQFWDEQENALNEQGLEIYALIFRYPEKLKLVIYDAELADKKYLKPFRALQSLKRNVRIIAENAESAYANTQNDFAFSGEKRANIHLSKADPALKNDFPGPSQKKINFFSYQAEDQERGLLAAALLWTAYKEAGKRLDGFTVVDGYLTLTGEFLRDLVQRAEARLTISAAA